MSIRVMVHLSKPFLHFALQKWILCDDLPWLRKRTSVQSLSLIQYCIWFCILCCILIFSIANRLLSKNWSTYSVRWRYTFNPQMANPPLKTIAGGSVANTIRGLASGFGVTCGIIGACGNDEQGELFLQNMKYNNVNLSNLMTKKGATAQVISQLFYYFFSNICLHLSF